MNQEHLELYLSSLPIAWACAYLSFFTFGVYRGLWRYVGMDDLVRYLKSALGGVVLVILAAVVLYPANTFPTVIFVLFAIFLFLGLAASRSSFKILDQVFAPQVRDREERVLICGAGDAGEMALRWIIMNPQLGYRPVGFLDDDAFKGGRQIHGVGVLGQLQQIESILSKGQIDGVILTPDVLTSAEATNQLVATCRSNGKWVRILRFEFELVE